MDESTIREKLSRIKCFMLDMDGTFYLGANLLDGSLDFHGKAAGDWPDDISF